jgi:hypothetical protein
VALKKILVDGVDHVWTRLFVVPQITLTVLVGTELANQNHQIGSVFVVCF